MRVTPRQRGSGRGSSRAYRRPLAGVSTRGREARVAGRPGRTTEERVREAVGRATGREGLGEAPVRRLAGHASMRSYWRVGAPPSAHVVMVMPKDARPEEVTQGGPPAVDPFVDVQGYLRDLGVRVPQILAAHLDDPEGGLIVLEDLGDDTLEARLLAGDDPEPLYRGAVDQLAALRSRDGASPRRCVAHARRFGVDLYRWELDHFREWLL